MTALAERPALDPALAAHRARRGSDWLDSHHRDWWSGIRLVDFRVANHSKCVLAWVYGDYSTGIARVFELMEKPRGGYTVLVDHGFDAALGPEDEREAYHEALQAAWVVEISSRQKRRAR